MSTATRTSSPLPGRHVEDHRRGWWQTAGIESTAAHALRYFLDQRALALGPRTPTEILLVVRTCAPVEDDMVFEVRGTGPDGEPVRAMATRSEVRAAVRRPTR